MPTTKPNTTAVGIAARPAASSAYGRLTVATNPRVTPTMNIVTAIDATVGLMVAGVNATASPITAAQRSVVPTTAMLELLTTNPTITKVPTPIACTQPM